MPRTMSATDAAAMPRLALRAAAFATVLAAASCHAAPEWPAVHSAIARDPAIEARVAAILAGMTLEQKIGQMTQPEIKSVTPEQVRRFYIGSVLNGGGSWPGGRKDARAADWLALAERYHAASMATDMKVKVPVIWGTDAIHGHSNVMGATLFPHNIGLGATRDPQLVERVAAATARAVRATGIDWVFGPTLAVVRDDRWGRTYESFSEDPQLVKSYAGAYVRGLQGNLAGDASVVATAKHFIGDGGTFEGRDRGVTRAPLADLVGIHAQGYVTALGAGAQTVMVSFSSWADPETGIDHGKIHGSRMLVTEVLKNKMGFDGLVVSDWNAIAEVPGCRIDSCPQAINAGIDMIMVPDDWQSFIANTIAQVKSGEIPMARIDDAVSRILRVKLRAGLFGRSPSQGAVAGKQDALQARELGREAVRKSLVLLKNDGGVLPLARGGRLLVVGRSADSMADQTGGWSLTWQGTDNRNSDFPHGDTILAGIAAAAGADRVTHVADAAGLAGIDLAAYDAVIAVVGETPYAEGDGDIDPARTLRHSERHPEDLAVLQAVAGKGKPVVTVFLSGRPLWVNDLLNRSDAFIAAWLPGTEGKGVADLLFRGADGKPQHDFSGTLSFSWPKAACQSPLNVGDKEYAPLFPVGYGLRYGRGATLGRLDDTAPAACGTATTVPVYSSADRSSYPLAIASGEKRVALGADLNSSFALPGIRAETAQINTQQDAKRITWTAEAAKTTPRFEARTHSPRPLPAWADTLKFDTIVAAAPQGHVTLAWDCGNGCAASVDATALFTRLAGKGRQTVKLPLACFAAKGARTDTIAMPFAVAADGALTASFAAIELVAGKGDAQAVKCEELQ